MVAKVNLVLEDAVKEELDQLIPAGERSRFANEALRLQLALVRRRKAGEKLTVHRQAGPHVSTPEVVRMLRSFRDVR